MHAQIKERIEQIISNIKELPSIPDIASHVISMVNNPDVSFKDSDFGRNAIWRQSA